MASSNNHFRGYRELRKIGEGVHRYSGVPQKELDSLAFFANPKSANFM
jgi:hypothetical protein